MAVVIIHPDAGHPAPDLNAGVSHRKPARISQDKKVQCDNDAIGNIVQEGVIQGLVLQASGHEGGRGGGQGEQDMIVGQLYHKGHQDGRPRKADGPQHLKEPAPVPAAGGSVFLHGGFSLVHR